MSFNEWSITQELLDECKKILPSGTILELGSGGGTEELARYYSMISVESDAQWAGLYKSNYIVVPLTDYKNDIFPESFPFFGGNDLWWYNPTILAEKLKQIDGKYDMVLVDGPKGYRGGMIDHIDLFRNDVPYIFDDTSDKYHRELFERVAKKFGKEGKIVSTGGKEFGVIL
jgi:hypothetical protein